jgi:DNA-binding GntR family transcriptional regulator
VTRASGSDGEAEVTDQLRTAILNGDYVAGQRLVEADLCERFGATRFVIRAALQVLTGQGLVEIRRHQGARVRVVSADEAIEITEVRQALEGLAAARAAERATSADRAELRRILKEMKAAARAGEPLRYSDTNAELHATIQRIAGHETASRIVQQLRGQMIRHQFNLAMQPGRPQVSLPQHEAVVAAILAGDPVAAESAMREHIGSVIAALRDSAAAGFRNPHAPIGGLNR